MKCTRSQSDGVSRIPLSPRYQPLLPSCVSVSQRKERILTLYAKKLSLTTSPNHEGLTPSKLRRRPVLDPYRTPLTLPFPPCSTSVRSLGLSHVQYVASRAHPRSPASSASLPLRRRASARLSRQRASGQSSRGRLNSTDLNDHLGRSLNLCLQTGSGSVASRRRRRGKVRFPFSSEHPSPQPPAVFERHPRGLFADTSSLFPFLQLSSTSSTATVPRKRPSFTARTACGRSSTSPRSSSPPPPNGLSTTRARFRRPGGR